jgi:hypothetical protein
VAEGVELRHPLKLLGSPGSVLMCRRSRAESALDIRANVRLDGVHVKAQRSACVRHHCGRLQISCCHLDCDPQRFDHLYCALVTLVRGSRLNGGVVHLQVNETVISGSLTAVQCRGDGQLQNVRVLFDGLRKRFWFTVVQVVSVGDEGEGTATRPCQAVEPSHKPLGSRQVLKFQALQKSMARKGMRVCLL